MDMGKGVGGMGFSDSSSSPFGVSFLVFYSKGAKGKR
jgi:hypothetical protein